MRPFLKPVLELGPLVIFFFANAKFGIFPATAAFMAATAVSLVLSWLLLRKIAVMPLVTGVFVMVFGGLTLYLENETFIKLKPTIVNLLFAAILFGGLFYERSLLKLVFDDVLLLTDVGWRKLTFRWASFFVVLAVLNEIVWRNFSTDFWVGFKVFGLMPLTFVFAMSQILLLQKHLAGADKGAPDRRPSALDPGE